MILINNLSEDDIGRWVYYKTEYKNEKGRIKSWNDKYVFVVYTCAGEWDNFQDYTGNATRPEDLYFIV
jgi:hypothetical protein